MKSKDLTNLKFGKLKAIELVKDAKYRSWKCICDCGTEKIIYQTHLIQGNIKSCGCIKHGSSSACWKGYGELSGDVWYDIRKKSKDRREKMFTIDIKFVWDLYELQQRKCAISGVDIFFGKTNEMPRTASLDRIDSSKGYEKDNVQWVHKDINIMKNRLDLSYFVYLCHLITNPLQPIVQINEDMLSGHKWYDIEKRKNKKEFNITKEYVVDLYNKQNGLCSMTNIPIFLNLKNSSDHEPVASLDRIDSSKGYIKGNVHWIHKSVNLMKCDYDLEYFKFMCKNVSLNNCS